MSKLIYTIFIIVASVMTIFSDKSTGEIALYLISGMFAALTYHVIFERPKL
jgi:quinol-cytochrome oxidoreductase complex cytochrome b subunit